MSEPSYEDVDDVLPDAPNGELVHWMEPRPRTFGTATVVLAAAGGFALGLATALLAVGMGRMPGRERLFGAPDRLRLGG